VALTWRRAPWIAFGIVWFAVTLVPVIGFVQAGMQGMADRFTYVPHIGLLAAAVWTLDAMARSRVARQALAGACGLVVLACAVASHRQAEYWQDSATMLERTLAVTHDNFVAEGSLGNVLVNAGRPADAYEHFAESLRVEPRYVKAAFGLGVAAEGLGRSDEAIVHYREALKIDPTYWQALNNLGIALFARGEVEAAVNYFGDALRLEPASEEVGRNLKLALNQLGVDDDGAARYAAGLVMWSARAAADRDRPGGAAFASTLPQQLLASRADVLRGCLAGGDGKPLAPFNLYVTVGADGGVAEVAPVPPTRVARCFGDELRAVHTTAPPFAPFHGQVAMRFEG